MKPKIVFFARDYQSILFPLLKSDQYDSFYVVLTIEEKLLLNNKNVEVFLCFEEEYDKLIITKENEIENLETSFFSDRYFCRHDINIRNTILSKEFAFWDKVFKILRPTHVVNEVIAIEMAEVLYLKAKEYNAEYLAWMVSPFPDKNFYWLTSPFHASLDKMIFTSVPDNNSLTLAQKYIYNFKSASNLKPFYASNLKSRFSTSYFFRVVIRYFKTKTIRRLSSKLKHSFLKEFYGFNDTSSINLKLLINSYLYSYNSIGQALGYEIIFYPLHYEPEASIIYFSEFNEDQPALIRNISKCIKRNQILIIKEHPQQPGMLLSQTYRKLRERLPNILYLPSEFSTKKLIELSKIVITQTSTAGWEALLLGKPVFVLGKVFYDNYEFINRFKGFENLRRSIFNEDYFYPDTEALVCFTAQFWTYCEFGNPYPHVNLFDKKNIMRLVSSIENKIANKPV